MSMSIEFPTLVYQTPGTHQCPGGTYAYQSAHDADQLDRLLEEGWFLSLPEALAGEHDESRYIELSHEGQNQQELLISDIPVDMACEVVQRWLGHRLDDQGVDHPEPKEGELLEITLLNELRTDAAAIVLQNYKDNNPTAQEWLLAKAKEVNLAPDDGLSAEELLFLICHAFAAKPEGVEEDSKPPTREELEAKAKELGITFDGRTTDKSLTEKIEHVLAEQAGE